MIFKYGHSTIAQIGNQIINSLGGLIPRELTVCANMFDILRRIFCLVAVAIDPLVSLTQKEFSSSRATCFGAVEKYQTFLLAKGLIRSAVYSGQGLCSCRIPTTFVKAV